MSKKPRWISHYAGPNNPCHEGDVVEVMCGCCDCAKAATFIGKILFKRRAVRQAYAGEVPWEQVHKYRIIDYARLTDAIQAAHSSFREIFTPQPTWQPMPGGRGGGIRVFETIGSGGSASIGYRKAATGGYDGAAERQKRKDITKKHLTLVKG